MPCCELLFMIGSGILLSEGVYVCLVGDVIVQVGLGRFTYL